MNEMITPPRAAIVDSVINRLLTPQEYEVGGRVLRPMTHQVWYWIDLLKPPVVEYVRKLVVLQIACETQEELDEAIKAAGVERPSSSAWMELIWLLAADEAEVARLISRLAVARQRVERTPYPSEIALRQQDDAHAELLQAVGMFSASIKAEDADTVLHFVEDTVFAVQLLAYSVKVEGAESKNQPAHPRS